MKNILKSALLATVLSGTSLMAGVVFDLGAQQLYYPITKLTDSDGYDTVDQHKEASYDVGTAIVSTGLTSVNGYYRPESSRTGYFGVRIKQPKVNTAISFSSYCYLDSNDGCSIQLLDENAQVITIDFDYYSNNGHNGKISIDGQTQYGIGNYNTNINGAIEINQSRIKITINGNYVFTVNKANFKLAKINFALYTSSESYISRIDKLTGLSISTND